MKSKITGNTLPVLEIGLESNDVIIAEPGEFSWMTNTVEMNTTTTTAGARGIWGAIGRAIGGGGLFMTEYTAPRGPGVIAFASKIPGSIMQLDVTPGKTYMIHRHGFVCATQGVSLSTGFQRSLGAGIFGGSGFVLQKLAGPCTAWVELGGETVIYDLQPGETLKVHPGHIGMFEDSVNFEITLMRGFMNAVFGGDGLFVAQLTGPGKVWLQSLTVPNLAHALAPYIASEGGTPMQNTDTGIAGGIAGAVLRDMFGNNR